MKTAFVTGANRGLGKGFVEYLLSQGYQVFAGVKTNISKLNSQQNLVYVECDVSKDDSIDSAVSVIASQTDHIDLLINNAGVNKDSVADGHKEKVCILPNLDRKLLLNMFDVNTVSPIIIIKKFLKLLKENDCFIINISSCRASFNDEYENGYPNYGYASSKYALNMMTFRLSKELPNNVKVFSVHPGNVKTDMNQSGEQSPYEQARNIINITKNWNSKLNGRFLNWNGEEYPL